MELEWCVFHVEIDFELTIPPFESLWSGFHSCLSGQQLSIPSNPVLS